MIALVAVIAVPLRAATRVLRVQSGAAASGADGASWATAYPNLSQALTAAQALTPTSADPVQLWIAVGAYTPDAPAEDPENGIFEPDPRDGTFNVPGWVSLYGGFAGTESDVGQRTFSDTAPMTVLSGDIGSTYLSSEAAPTTRAEALAATVRDPENANYADNVTNVVTIRDAVGVTLDGLLITGGYACNLATVPLDYVQAMAMPDAMNADTLGSKRAITREAAGGGIYIESSTLPISTAVTLTNCILVQNHAFGFGGGLSIIRSRVASSSNLYVANSAADAGGAVFGRAQFSRFEGDVMLRNLSQGNGGAVQLNTPPVRPSDWANSMARELFGSESAFALETVSGQVDVAAMTPGVTAPRAGLLSLEGAAALSTKIALGKSAGGFTNYAGISTYGMSKITAVIDVTDLVVNELRVQGVDGAFIDFWVEDFMPTYTTSFTPQGWYKTYQHAFWADAKFDEKTPEWQVKAAYDIFFNPAEPTRFVGVRFDDNTAYGDGGALFALHANYFAERCLFTENSSESSGGAIAQRAFSDTQVVNSVFSANSSAGQSAISLAQSVRLRLLNCTVVNNVSSAINGYALGCELGSELRVLNSVLWGNISESFPSGGADVYTTVPAELDATIRKVYDAAPAHRFTFIGMTDIVGSNVQSLADLENSWGVSSIRYLSGSNLSDADIAVAQRMRDLADYSSTTDLFELTVMGQGNRYIDRGNISVDPQLHDGWLPGVNSPLINKGRFDSYELGAGTLSGRYVDFVGAARTPDHANISIGAVQSPTASSGSGTAEAAGRTFVTPTGAGDKSGRNWANASDDLKTMLAQDNAEIWVQAGTYHPSATADRFAAFTLGENTRAYGGFAGTETVFADRDVAANVTLLSGQLNGVQSYHVVKQSNTEGSLLIDGFTIVSGKADGWGEDAAGGGAYLFNTAITLRNVTFDGNTATDTGGAVSTAGEAKVNVFDCVFTDNTSASGGAIYGINPILIERCRFDSNTASQKGGAVAIEASGDSDQRADFHNSLFSRNTVTDTGAGSAIYVSVLVNEIVNCTITKNTGRVYSDEYGMENHVGSAVYFAEVPGLVVNSILWKNSATEDVDFGLPLELASIYAPNEDSFGLLLSHSVIEGLGMTNPLTGTARAEGSLTDQATKVGGYYVRIGSSPSTYVDTCYDYEPGFADFDNNDFRLSAGSNLVDHGDDDAVGIGFTDLASLPRQTGEKIDLGAYEFQGTSESVFSAITTTRALTDDGPVYTLVLHPENTLGSDATYTWMVNMNDGRGFVALPDDARISGEDTDTLTISQPPSAWRNWVFRVTVGGTNTATASVVLTAKGSERFYVNGAVAASGDGLSWATAFKTISEATLAARNALATSDYCQIWVAQGAYSPVRSTGEFSVYLYSGMVLYGGFAGDETAPSERNPTLYPTILTGNPDYADPVIAMGPANSTLPIVVDGFTVREARGAAISAPAGASNSYTATVSNCIIENERATGAAVSTDITFRNVILRKNKNRAVTISGGNVTFEKTLFAQNSGSEGAALQISGGSVSITTSTIADNFAMTRVGGIYQSGGTLTIDQSILWGNRDNATELGSALEPSQLYRAGGTLTITDSLIEGISAFTGGGNLGFHPLFNDALNFNYTLAAPSPAIALGAGAFPYSGTPDTTLRFTSIPNSTEERTSLFSKDYTIAWLSGAGHTLHWEIDLGNGWIAPTSSTLNTSTSANATSATLTLSSSSILPSLRVRAINAAGVALPPITLKVVPPVVRYVNASATGTADGLSWNTGYRTLAAAYDNLPGPNVELWVAKGTYSVDGIVQAQPGVTLYGGFAGTETALNERVLSSANVTTLNGTFLIATGEFTYGQGLPVAARSVGRQVVLDGFRFERQGSGAAALLLATGGAGIVRNCDFVGAYTLVDLSNVSTVFEHCSFTGSTEPAVKIADSNPTFRSCTFTGNTSNLGGGAIDSSSSEVLVDRSTFTGNKANFSDGGAIRNRGGSFTIANSLFAGNSAANGGALSGTNFRIVNCTFADNRAQTQGGGLYSSGGCTVSNSIFWGNTAGPNLYGDAAATQKAQLTPYYGSLVVNTSIIEGLVGNLGSDNQPYHPLFLGSGSAPYQLTASSPAIGRALAADLEAVSPIAAYSGRLEGGSLDLGAFEFSGTAVAPLQLTSSPASTALFTGATTSFVVSGDAGIGANIAWERLVNGVWVLVSGSGFTIATTSTASTLTIANATTAQAGTYRYRIASLGYVSPSFSVDVTARRVVYVDANASAGGNGATWGTAFQSLAAAASLLDAAIEVRVAAGTYASPNIVLRPGLYYRGGYPASGSAAQRAVSDPSVNVTRLTGAIAQGDGTSQTFDTSTGFEGFTFAGGGSGLQFTRGVIVFFRNCQFTGMTATGGFAGLTMFTYSCSALFEDCSFAGNASPAIHTRYFSVARVVRGTFSNNTGTVLAASDNGAFTVEDSTVSNNAFLDYVGLIDTNRVNSSGITQASTITRTLFTGNSGGVLIKANGGPLTVTDSLFTGNTGPIATIASDVVARHLTVVDNRVAQVTSGSTLSSRPLITHSSGALEISNSIFWSNEALGASTSLEQQQIKRSGGMFLFRNNLLEGFSTLGGADNFAYDPLFADRSAGDYTLSSSSPAIAAGLAEAGTALDLGQISRSGTPDLGAFDFTGTAETPVLLDSTPVSVAAYLRDTASFTVTGVAGADITWLRWDGSAFVVIDPNNTGDSRLTITHTADGTTLTLAKVATTDTNGFAYQIGGYRSAVLTITPTVRPRVYVDAASTVANGTGASWTQAYRSFEYAYKYAPDSAEIWVKSGSYAANVTLRAGIEVYGGFTTNATDVGDRDLSGENTIIAGQFKASAATPGAVLDGLTLTASYTPLYLYGPANPTLRRCVIRDSSAGGVEISGGASPVFEDCTFRANTKGSLIVSDGEVVVLRGEFTGGGKAISSQGGKVVVTDSLFYENRGTKPIIEVRSSGEVVLDRSTVRDNTGDTLLIAYDGKLTLRNSLVVDNASSYHGVLNAYTLGDQIGELEVIQCTLYGNESIYGPGGIFTSGGTVTVNNSILWGNRGRYARTPAISIEEQQILRTSGDLTLGHSIVEGFSALGGSGNLAEAPLFVDAGSDDFTLSAVSPAIDAGDATVDQTGFALDRVGNARVAGAAPDLGAYEFTGTPETALRIVRSPTSVDVATGGVATFVVESATSGAFTWQVESSSGVWTTIADGGIYTVTVSGNTSTLSVGPVTAADDGARFRYLFGTTASPAFTLSLADERIIYVDTTATGTADGTTWATAFRTIQDAINDWSVGAEIWVARKATITLSQPLVLEEGMKLYGGFAGNEVTLAQRFAGSQTTLRDLGSSSGIGYFFDQSNTPVTRATVLDGFTFDPQRPQHAVVLVSSSPVIRNCTFSRFTAEAIRNTGGSPLIEGCNFLGNTSNAVRDIGASSEIASCVFDSNTSVQYGYVGSAIRVEGNLSGQPTQVRDSVFRSNRNVAVALTSGATLTFERCTWTGNVNAHSAVMDIPAGSTVTVRNSLITGNTGSFLHDLNNSAILTNAGTLTLVNVTVAGNTVASWSSGVRRGAVLYNTGALTIANSIFAENTVTGDTTGVTAEEQQILSESSAVPAVSYSLIAGLSAYAGNGNVGYLPNFDPTHPGEYRLSIYSPAVNAGDNTTAGLPATDVAGNNRLVGSTVDLGARELAETVGVSPLQVNLDANSGYVVPVWSTAPGQLVITGSVGVTSAIYWEILIDGQWVAIAADSSLSSSFNSTSATLSIAAPADDTIADRSVRFGIRGTSFVSTAYTVTTSRNNIRYVNTYAAAGGDGLTWDTAFATIAEAAASAPSHTEIWVAKGTYADTSTINLGPALRIYGGFIGRETTRAARDSSRYAATIGNSFTISNAAGSDTPIIDGVNLDGGSVSLHHRSAIFLKVKFLNGGALTAASYAPSLLLEDCRFANKNVALSGYIDSVTIRRTTFTGNEQAVSASGLAWTIEDSTFEASVNRTGRNAAHFLTSTVPTLTISGTTFADANSRTPAISLSEPGGYTVVATFADCVFTGNKATLSGAGAIDASGLTLSFDRCTFIGNASQGGTTFGSASVLKGQGVELSIRNSYFSDNTTNGGLSPVGTGSGAIYLYNSASTLAGVTLVNNTAPSQNSGGLVLDGGSATIVNSILYGNDGGSGTIEDRQLRVVNSTTLNAHHSLIEGLATFADGSGMIGHNPRFITVNSRLVPGPDSPARNVGDNTALLADETDLFGNARTNEDTVDLGAIEPTTLATTAVLDLAQTRRVAGGYLEITFDNSRNYAGLVWQIDTGSGWQTLSVPADALITSGTLTILLLPWSPELYEGARIRLLGTNYTSTIFTVAFGDAPAATGTVVSIAPTSGSTAGSTRPAITVTFDQAQNGLTPANLVVHGSLHGRLAASDTWGSVTADAQSPVLTPGIAFDSGETIEVSATSAITTTIDNGAVTPYVARFFAPWTSRAGKFRRGSVLATTGNVTGAASGDIDGDGYGDVMFIGDDGAWIYLGDGEGGFTRLQYGATGGWNAFALADFDGDGRIDFIGSRNKSSLTIETLDAATVSTTSLLTSPLAYAGTRLLPGDFNGDGRQDVLVLGASTTGGETLLSNNGDGTFAAGAQSFAPGDDRTREAAVADLDHDGDLDFVQVRAATGDIVVWLNDGSGVFVTDTAIRIADTQTIALTDLDRDGWTDLVVAGGSGSDTLHVYRNDRSGRFVFQRAFAAGSVRQLAAADFDGDGDNDLLAISGIAADTLWANNGSGVFTSTALAWTSVNASAAAQLAVADLNNDGAADVALPQSSRIAFWTPGNYFAGFTKTTPEGSTLTFAESDFAAATEENVNTALGVYPVDSYVILSLPTHGTLKVNGNALSVGQSISYHSNVASTYTYTPAANTYGVDSFTVAPKDYLYRSPGARVTLNVTRVVDAPMADAQTVTVFKNQDRTISLTGSHPEGEAMTFAIGSQPTHGAVTLSGRQATYTPSAEYTGSDSFVFHVSDAFGNTTAATVSLNVIDAVASVTNTAASGDGSLANAIASMLTAGGGRIVLDAALAGQTLTLAGATDNAHSPTAVLVANYLEIDGSAATGAVIARDAGTAELRLFRVASGGTLIVKNVELADAVIRSETASLPARGAAIYNEGTVQLDAVTLRNHYAHGLTNTGAEGGAIYNDGGTLTLTSTNVFDNHAEDDSGQGSGGGIFLRNGSATFESTSFIGNLAPTTGPSVHVLGDDAAATTTWDDTFLTGLSVARIGAGSVSTIDLNNALAPVAPITPAISRVQLGQIFGITDVDIDVNSATAVLTVSHYDNTFYQGTGGVPASDVVATSGTTRTLRITPAENTGGVTHFVLTATEDGISYSNEFALGFLTSVFHAPTVADADVYVIDGAATPFSLTATHGEAAVTIELLTLPTHGTLTPGATSLDYTYTPAPGYEGDDYLIYRANTEQGLPASARITFRNVGENRLVTTADASGPGSLAEILAHTPSILYQNVNWTIAFAPELAGQTITLPSTPLDTPAGPSAFIVSGFVELDGAAAPGLKIVRADSAPEMRLFYVAPTGYLQLKNLTVGNGLAVGEGGQPGRGGAVYLDRDSNLGISGTASFANVTFEGNIALGGSGANGEGGAIYGVNSPLAFDTVHFVDNAAIGGTGGTGIGGAIYAVSGGVGFSGQSASASSSFAGNLADQGSDIALVADGTLLGGDDMLAVFFNTDTTGVYSSLVNGGTLAVTAYESIVSGPGLFSIAPLSDIVGAADVVLPLTLANGPAESIAYAVPAYLDGLVTLTGTLAAPSLDVKVGAFDNGGRLTVTAERAGVRFERKVTFASNDYYPPYTEGQELTVTMNQPLSISLYADVHPSFRPGAYEVFSPQIDANDGPFTPADGGTITGVGPAVTYTPPTNFIGDVSFTYSVEDSHGGSSSSQITIHVTSGQPLAYEGVAPAQSGGSVSTTVTVEGGHETGDTVSYVLVSSTSHGTLQQVGSTAQFNYTPEPGYLTADHASEAPNFGYDVFTFKTVDSLGRESAAASFYLAVADYASNLPPTITGVGAAPGPVLYVNENRDYLDPNPNLLYAGITIADPEDAQLTLILKLSVTHGYNAVDASDPWTQDYDPALGDYYSTTGTAAELTERLRRVVFYTDLTLPDGTSPLAQGVLFATTSEIQVSDSQQTVSAEVPAQALNPWTRPSSPDDLMRVTTAPGAPVAFSFSVVQPEGRPIYLTAPWWALYTPGTGDLDEDYSDITSTSATYGTLTGGLANLNDPAQSMDQLDWTFTPVPGFTGQIILTWNFTTPLGSLGGITVFLYVTNPPVGVDDAVLRGENAKTILVSSLLANDTDPDGDALSFVAAASTSANGIAIAATTVDGAPALVYPASTSKADDSFVYTLQDANGATATATVHLTFENSSPVAVDDVAERDYGQPLTLTAGMLLANDSDPENDSLQLAAVTATSALGGTVTLADGVVTYTPPANADASDTFGYTVADSRGATAAATVTINLANRAPIAADRTLTRYNDQPASVVVAELLALGSDPDGDALQLTRVDSASVLGATVANASGTITYSTATSSLVKDEDYFTYSIEDSRGAAATGIVTVQLVNRAPVASADSLDRTNDQDGTISTATLLANDTDPDGDAVTFASVGATSAQGATLSVANGVITYRAASATAIVGDDTFTYTMCDPAGLTSSATVTVRLLNRAPVAAADTLTHVPGTPITVAIATLLANDTDPDLDTFVLTSFQSTSAQSVPVTRSGDDLLYTPNAAVSGDDTFTYTIEDVRGATATATVTVKLADAPTPTLTISNRNGGGASLQLQGAAFTVHTIFVSTDLATWTPLATVTTDAQGHATAEDAIAPVDSAARFYRAESN